VKLAALAVLALAIGSAGGCSVNHRSGDFACQIQSDCSKDRTCIDGFCVLAADAGIDTPPPLPDAAVCPTTCTSCNPLQKTCTIDCTIAAGNCKQLVTCPTGWSCNVLCSRADACSNGVICPNGTACTITCSGLRSCKGISCGTGRCNVDCGGTNSCQDVRCGLSCGCDVTCHINSTCSNLACRAGCTSASQFGGCTSLTAGCNTCQ
jgi:hypothetical protein